MSIFSSTDATADGLPILVGIVGPPVTPDAVPSSTGILNASAGPAVTVGPNSEGMPNWSIPLSFTTPGILDPNCGNYQYTVDITDQYGNEAPFTQGGGESLVGTAANDGKEVTDILLGSFNISGSIYTYARIIIYGLNPYSISGWEDPAAVPQQWPDTNTYKLINFGQPPPGVIPANRLDATTLDPTMKIDSDLLGVKITGPLYSDIVQGGALNVRISGPLYNDVITNSLNVRIAGPVYSDPITGALNIQIAGPLYADVVTGALGINLSSDFVVSGGVLTQNAIDLAKALNYDTTQFTKTDGLFVVDRIAVNHLIAGTALFTDDVIFARVDSGKITINAAGIAIASDLNLYPAATLTLASTGLSVVKGSNSLTMEALGLTIIQGNYRLTMLAAGIGLYHVTGGNIQITPTSIQMADSYTLPTSTVTIAVSGSLAGISLVTGSNTLAMTSLGFTLTGVSGNTLTMLDTGIIMWQTGGGKVTLNTSGLTMANNSTSPTSTVTIAASSTSAGISLVTGTHSLAMTSLGLTITAISSVTTTTSVTNILTMLATGIILKQIGGGQFTVNTNGITLANAINTPTSTVTIAASSTSAGLSLVTGSNILAMTSLGFTFTQANGALLTLSADGIYIVKGSNSVKIAADYVTIVGGKLTSPVITAGTITSTTLTSVNIISATISAGISISAPHIIGGIIESATLTSVTISAGMSISAPHIIGGIIESATLTSVTISAGAVITSPVIIVSGGLVLVNIDSTNGILVTNYGSGNSASLNGGFFYTSYTSTSLLTYGSLSPYEFTLQAYHMPGNSPNAIIKMDITPNFGMFTMENNLSLLQIRFYCAQNGAGIQLLHGANLSANNIEVISATAQVNCTTLFVLGNTMINALGQFVGFGVKCIGSGIGGSGFNINNTYFGAGGINPTPTLMVQCNDGAYHPVRGGIITIS